MREIFQTKRKYWGGNEDSRRLEVDDVNKEKPKTLSISMEPKSFKSFYEDGAFTKHKLKLIQNTKCFKSCLHPEQSVGKKAENKKVTRT